MKKLISLLLSILLMFHVGAQAFAEYTEPRARAYEADDCTVTYTIVNEWDNCQQINMSITNNGGETLRNWALKFDCPGEITNIWNAEVCKNDGEIIALRNSGYNYEIIPDGTVDFGFQLWGDDLRLPESISLCNKTVDSTADAEIGYEIKDMWDDGFIAEVSVTNNSDTPFEAWRLSFDGNFEITNLWNANKLYSENGFLVENNVSTMPIAKDETKTFGFQGVIASGKTPELSNFVLTSAVIDLNMDEPTEPDKPIDPDNPVDPDTQEHIILCFGEYVEKEKALEIYWYSTDEGAITLYENTDDSGWTKLADITEGDSYKYKIAEDFIIKQIKAVQETENGTLESEPFIVALTDDGYVCTWLDSDNDGLPDYIEKAYGTDPNNSDTDGDSLTDYEEIYITGTNPLKYDTDENGVNDAEDDPDGDGLSNKEEIELGTSPNSADTDGDGLSDFDEINKYDTDPLKADSDEDTLSDGDEITIGLDPNDPETFGVPDAEYKVEQTISADSETMSRVNTEEAPYELSLELSASGNAAKHLIAGGSIYSGITESDARLGGAVGLNYFGGEVGKVKLIYEINDEYISNDGSEYAENSIDLSGIKRYNIFRYFEDLNMLLPVVTEFDEENNILYAETDQLGTYCVLDMEVLMRNLGIAPDGSSVESITRQMYSAAPASASGDSDMDKYCVTFIFDIRKDIVSSGQLETFKEYVSSFANEVFAEERDITIRLMTQDVTDFFTDSYKVIGECTDIDDFNKTISRIKISDEEGFFGNYCIVTDALTYVLENAKKDVKNYVFDIYDQTDAIFDKEAAEKFLENDENHVNISMISNFPQTITGFQREIVLGTSGININSSKDFGERIYNHVFNDFIPEPMSAILISGYQEIELKGRLNQYNGIDSDYEECAEGEDDLHKNDHLTDWEEVGVDHWVEAGLMSYDDEGNAILPTIIDCLKFTELTYVKEGLKRFEQELGANFGAAIYGRRVLPILSDPTRADSDGDGIVDKYDPHKLVAGDIDTPCLYNCGVVGVENHNMLLDLNNETKTYVCDNCGYSKYSPEYDDVYLNPSDYLLVDALKNIGSKFMESETENEAVKLYLVECISRLIDHIRETSHVNYNYCDAKGNYASPIKYVLTSGDITPDSNDIFTVVSVDEYKKTRKLLEAYATVGRLTLEVGLCAVDCYLAGISLSEIGYWLAEMGIIIKMGRIAIKEEEIRAMVYGREFSWQPVIESMSATVLDAVTDIGDELGGFGFSSALIVKSYLLPIISQYCIVDYGKIPDKGTTEKYGLEPQYQYHITTQILSKGGGYSFSFDYDFYGYNYIEKTSDSFSKTDDSHFGRYRNAVEFSVEDIDGGRKERNYITGIVGSYYFEDVKGNGLYIKKRSLEQDISLTCKKEAL